MAPKINPGDQHQGEVRRHRDDRVRRQHRQTQATMTVEAAEAEEERGAAMRLPPGRPY
ncbi:hypothetical protein [Amycolatopsis sp. NPDC051903]|uniref:hypothetical protein n=1 Tax=Amycolatopsis sp. NPDC051903 TaxID=3363936 RepID=UPI003788DB4E